MNYAISNNATPPHLSIYGQILKEPMKGKSNHLRIASSSFEDI